jgi:hypothetical protein
MQQIAAGKRGNKMDEVVELVSENTIRRLALAEALHTNQIGLESYRGSIISLADREAKQIAELLGKLGA